MSIYNVSGSSLSSVFSVSGSSLSTAYNVSGTVVYSAQTPSTYEETINTARNAWATEYRADSTIIPVIIHTDQHRYLNAAHKPTFDYLAQNITWSEVSAIINLGDVCGAVYNTTDLDNMVYCLSSLPVAKRIDIAGNHDCQKTKTDDGYSYSYMAPEEFAYLQTTYFNNSQYGGNNSDYRYGTYGMEYMIDPVKSIKFCVFAVWHTGSAPDYDGGQPWYAYKLTYDDAEAIITMLSAVDNYDIVILSHIEPYARSMTLYKPAVDGNSASSSTVARGTGALGYSVQLDQLYADRKAKRSGILYDIDGTAHPYNFAGCTSDLLCSLNGHWHEDNYAYSPDGTVPMVEFDAYRYDNVPMYFVNIDRTRQRLNVWKFDEANNIYNYQVPFSEVTP